MLSLTLIGVHEILIHDPNKDHATILLAHARLPLIIIGLLHDP